MKRIPIALFLTGALACGSAAQAPLCSSSGIRFLQVLNDGTGALVEFAVSPPQPLVQGYFLDYTFNIDSDPAPGSLPVPAPGAPQLLTNIPLNHLHAFTARNVCTDGSIHTGATFFLDFRDAHENCPAIREFQLLDFDPAFASFSWGAALEADSFRVSYRVDALPEQIGFTPEPFWEQALLPATIHTFGIAALCTVPGLVQQAVVEGPEFVFSIIIIDDIKAIAVPVDTGALQEALCKGYRILCDHGNYGTDKERFIADHLPFGIPATCPVVVPVGETAFASPQLILAPNPAGNEVWCTLSGAAAAAGAARVELLDYSGRLYQRREIRLEEGNCRFPLHIGAIPPGLYVIRLTQAARTFSAKMAKR